MSSTYTFARGPVRSPETWEVGEAGISGPNGQSAAWVDVTAARFSHLPAAKSVTELHLITENETLKLQCNDSADGTNRYPFLRLARHVAQELDRANPSVRFGSPLGLRILPWALLALGAAGILFGLWLALTNIFSDDGAGIGIGFGVAIALFGVFLTWCGSPWAETPDKTPSETVEWIDRLLATG